MCVPEICEGCLCVRYVRRVCVCGGGGDVRCVCVCEVYEVCLCV